MLAEQLSVLVALSPALAVRGLAEGPLAPLVRSDPSALLAAVFGRRAVLALTLRVQEVLSPAAWVRLIDWWMRHLFGWRLAGMAAAHKEVAYRHIFDLGSVKLLAHWFQVLASRRFAMFR